ncbi:MAG: 4Fe-4S cluster-binding domain-containing protein, partial [Bacteroidota bacterium]
MKGLIFDIKHYAVHDGPGIRQTVFFKGCPLSCLWCHNPESQLPKIEHYTKENKLDGQIFRNKQAVGYEINTEALMEIIEGDRIFFDESGGGVTFSGGEPLMQP